jgi:hypothetical protein
MNPQGKAKLLDPSDPPPDWIPGFEIEHEKSDDDLTKKSTKSKEKTVTLTDLDPTKAKEISALHLSVKQQSEARRRKMDDVKNRSAQKQFEKLMKKKAEAKDKI